MPHVMRSVGLLLLLGGVPGANRQRSTLSPCHSLPGRRPQETLGCLSPSQEPKATDYIPHMIAMIQRIIANGHAYAVGGDVFFDVASLPGYGRLSGRSQVRGAGRPTGAGRTAVRAACAAAGELRERGRTSSASPQLPASARPRVSRAGGQPRGGARSGGRA